MKSRTSFVTNSSASSFICKKCGEEISGWDWEEDFQKEICNICENQTNITESTIYEFISLLSKELDLEESKLIQIYENWRDGIE